MALAACSADAPSLQGFAFGKKPPLPSVDPSLYPDHYQDQIAALLRTYLGNPSKIKDAFIAEPVLRPVAGEQHYVTCVRYNARNSSNVYQGSQTRLAIFTGGRLNQFLPEDPQICAGLNYRPSPQIEALVP